MSEKREKIDEFLKILPETLLDRELVKRGFYLSLAALRREWKLGINCPVHSKNEKGELFCTRESLIKWLCAVLKETGMLHYAQPENKVKTEGPKWVQLEFDW